MGEKRFFIGLRTLKTAAAILIAMLLVDQYGATTAKLIFAMLGAMAAVQPTFRASLEACLAQILGVIFGASVGVLLLFLPISRLTAAALGTILVIAAYNFLRVSVSPSLPCFILVMVCTTPDILPMTYAAGRIWDTAIGLAVGMAINMLIFPYDNRRKIQATMESLDRDLIHFLEDMFDGDRVLPDAADMEKKIRTMEKQLDMLEDQRLLFRRRGRRRDLARFRSCDEKVRELASHMEVLSRMETPGRLNEESRRRLAACGAEIRDQRPLASVMEADVVTNYHVDRILSIRLELLEELSYREK